MRLGKTTQGSAKSEKSLREPCKVRVIDYSLSIAAVFKVIFSVNGLSVQGYGRADIGKKPLKNTLYTGVKVIL
ncbi:hypothetical protein CWB98_16185 [Pseudoalteromonas rubra]|uniref:Uncharacterized protein n=1 Tax=Pseudoalteromonas rubra TaxID=43658 RepID=A0A5S3WYB9_9GAMM|nr:hypothetical protein CWB98_16185 [Pseudoalteromonas rubra]